MLIWINGAFGAGKSTVAERIHARRPDHLVYDPELVGALVRRLVPDPQPGDFQDLPIWRSLVADVALALHRHYHQPVVVPMTLVRPEYHDEIFSAIRAGGFEIRAFSLVVSPEELRRRIHAQVLAPENPSVDQEIREWRLRQVERCVGALRDDRLGRRVSNEDRPVDDVVDEILGYLEPSSGGTVMRQ